MQIDILFRKRGKGRGVLIEQSRINPNGLPGLFHFAGWSVYQTRASDVPGCSILQNGGVIKRLKAAICLPEVNLYKQKSLCKMLKLSRLVIKCGPMYIYWPIQLAKRRNIFSKKKPTDPALHKYIFSSCGSPSSDASGTPNGVARLYIVI